MSPPASIEDIAPSQYSPGAVPGSLAAPPLSPYVSRKLHLNCFFFFLTHFYIFVYPLAGMISEEKIC